MANTGSSSKRSIKAANVKLNCSSAREQRQCTVELRQHRPSTWPWQSLFAESRIDPNTFHTIPVLKYPGKGPHAIVLDILGQLKFGIYSFCLSQLALSALPEVEILKPPLIPTSPLSRQWPDPTDTTFPSSIINASNID